MTADTSISHHTSSLSGPQGLPLLGAKAHILHLYLHPIACLRQLYTTYGDIVILTKNDPMLVFAFGPQHNFRLLSNPDLFHANSERSSFLKLPPGTPFARILLNNLLRMDGEQHRQQRRLLLPTFHKKHIVSYHHDMIDQTQHLLDQWKVGREFELVREMQRLTQNVIVKTLFGLDDKEKAARLSELMHKLTKVMAMGALLPSNIPGSPYHQALQISQTFDAEIRAIIEQKRTQREATDILSVLIQTHDEDGEKLSDDQLIGHIFALYAAGHQTTANALTWTNFLLEQHPHVLADLLDELNDTLHSTPPTIEQLPQLSLLEGVVKESLRLFPPAMMGMRVATSTCELGSYEFAGGTNILYSEFITHRMPELYEEPNRFRPERWLTLERSPYEYLPFSAGHHMCIAASFALQELKIVLAMMLQRYRLEVRPNAKLSIDFNMRAKPGVPVRVFPQDRQFKRTPVRGSIQNMIERD